MLDYEFNGQPPFHLVEVVPTHSLVKGTGLDHTRPPSTRDGWMGFHSMKLLGCGASLDCVEDS